MTELSFKGNWRDVKKELKDRYPILTDKDLDYKEDDEEELLAHLEERIGLTKHEIKKMIRDLNK